MNKAIIIKMRKGNFTWKSYNGGVGIAEKRRRMLCTQYTQVYIIPNSDIFSSNMFHFPFFPAFAAQASSLLQVYIYEQRDTISSIANKLFLS